EKLAPQMLPLVQLDPEHIAHIVNAAPGGAENIQDIYPLAPLQEGILFHHLFGDGDKDAYLLGILLSVDTPQLIDKLITSIQLVIDRHDILRSAVFWEH